MSRRTSKPVRQESWRYVRVRESWRRPRGKSSRVRRSIRGWPKKAKVGNAGERKRRGIPPSGIRSVVVTNPAQLSSLDPKKQAALIAHTVGERKRVAIVEKAKELGVRIKNPRLKKPEAAEELAVEPTEPETVTETESDETAEETDAETDEKKA